MRDGFTIIDADRHVSEPIDLWSQYLPGELRRHAPTFDPVLSVDGQPAMRGYPPAAQAAIAYTTLSRHEEVRAASRAAGQLRFMDRSGIDVAFLVPTFALYLACNDRLEPELTAAFATAYNNWLEDFCRLDPDRLRGMGLVATHHPPSLAAEVERVARAGWRAVVVRPNPARGRTLGHPDLAPLWESCERHGLAVVVHEGTHGEVATTGADRFSSRFAQHACSHPMEQMMAFLALYEAGVLDRHPRLRVGFLEAGCGWLPAWLHRLDGEHAHLAAEVRDRVTTVPSQTFRRQCFVGFEPEEPYLAALLPHLDGGRLLLFGTDFPHPDHELDIVEVTLALPVDPEVKRRLLADNAARFFGLG